MKRSLVAKGVSGLLSLTPQVTEERRNKDLIKYLNKGEKRCNPPKLLKTKYVDNDYGRIFYVNEESKTNTVIIYIHGGAYCSNINYFHWSLIKKLIKRTNVKIIVPDYRLVPFGTYQDAFNLIIPIYQECLKNNNKVILMGDSSGGGLALSIALYLKENNIKLPDRQILISPWVDGSMNNIDIKDYEKIDPMLNSEGLKVVTRKWMGNLDEDDWQVSPIYGDLTNLNNITIFVGTREIFYPDIIKLYNKLDKKTNKLIVGKDMNHAYPLIPIPEAKEAITTIVDIVNK